MKVIGYQYYCFSLLLAAGMLFTACSQECALPERCLLAPDPGPCFALMPRYYYDQESQQCRKFIYGGCQGVVPFETLEACQVCDCR